MSFEQYIAAALLIGGIIAKIILDLRVASNADKKLTAIDTKADGRITELINEVAAMSQRVYEESGKESDKAVAKSDKKRADAHVAHPKAKDE